MVSDYPDDSQNFNTRLSPLRLGGNTLLHNPESDDDQSTNPAGDAAEGFALEGKLQVLANTPI